MAWNLALADGVHTTHFAATQTTCHGNHDALTAGAHRLLNGLFHSALPANAPLQLLGDALCHQEGIEFRLGDFAHIDLDLLAAHLLKLGAQHINTGALASDNHARSCGV